MPTDEEEDIPVEILRQVAADMGKEAKRRAIAAGIDINRPQPGHRKMVKIDPSRWMGR
jgi:hypothetical protein